MTNVYLDIETIPQQGEEEIKAEIAKEIQAPASMKKTETIEAWHNGEGKYAGEKECVIDEQYRKMALDGGTGHAISIAWSVDGENIKNVSTNKSLDGGIVAYFASQLTKELHGRKPFFVGHNIKFDLEFLYKRFVVASYRPAFDLPFSGRHNQHFYCTMQAWAGYNKYISQDKLCKILGLDGKPDDIDGSQVYDYWKAGKIDDIANYNKSDVETVIKIYNRLEFVNA